MNYIRKIKRIDYHRNGVSGAPFHIVRFTTTAREDRLDMIAIVFDTPAHVAVFDFDLVKQDNFMFSKNSWRGDNFEKELREAIKKYESER